MVNLKIISKLKKDNPEIIIGVLGCMAQNLKDSILQNKTYVDIVLGPDSYRKIVDFIRDRKKEKSFPFGKFQTKNEENKNKMKILIFTNTHV